MAWGWRWSFLVCSPSSLTTTPQRSVAAHLASCSSSQRWVGWQCIGRSVSCAVYDLQFMYFVLCLTLLGLSLAMSPVTSRPVTVCSCTHTSLSMIIWRKSFIQVTRKRLINAPAARGHGRGLLWNQRGPLSAPRHGWLAPGIPPCCCYQPYHFRAGLPQGCRPQKEGVHLQHNTFWHTCFGLHGWSP